MTAVINKTEMLEMLKTQLLSFFDELIETIPSETDFVVFRVSIENRISVETIMNYIVKNLCPLSEMIKTKNPVFFGLRNILFELLENYSRNIFQEIWESNKLDSEDKKIIWEWFESLVLLGERYKKTFSR